MVEDIDDDLNTLTDGVGHEREQCKLVSLLSGVYRWVLGECGGVVLSFAVVYGVQHSGAVWPCPQRRACSALASACTFVIGLGSISGVSVIE